SANGFIYAVSVNGVTGVRDLDYAQIGKVTERVEKETDVPVAIGFGIGSPKAAENAAKYADAIIVGSAVVRRLLDGKLSEVAPFIKSLRDAIDK
ncbi:MAG: tryptophan synthase subunit alpha, partial [Selenomonadaceae bacterium]